METSEILRKLKSILDEATTVEVGHQTRASAREDLREKIKFLEQRLDFYEKSNSDLQKKVQQLEISQQSSSKIS
jgi:chaperonin cofactor prefoldin